MLEKKQQIKETNVFKIIVTVFLILYSLSILYLMFWALNTSVKAVDEFRKDPLGLPTPITFENFGLVIKNFSVPINNPQDGLMYEIFIEQQRHFVFWKMISGKNTFITTQEDNNSSSKTT